MTTVAVIGLSEDKKTFDVLNAINTHERLAMSLSWHDADKLNDKNLWAFLENCTDDAVIAIIKNTPTIIKATYDKTPQLIKSSLNWQSLTKRIVSAGKKSELILQACKLTADMRVVDGTAGFGHDGLILASTGAMVAMIEKNPIIALLLFYEHHIMNNNKNWQKLLSRIRIYHGDFLSVIARIDGVDLVYLDPMFPNDSYSAKVGKNMQILHRFATPPTPEEQVQLFNVVYANAGSKLVVKRPIHAPYLADKQPAQSFANDAIRFDRYDVS